MKSKEAKVVRMERLKDKEEMGYPHLRNSVRGKMITVYQDEPRFKKSVLVSAVKGLIKYHETKIKEFMTAIQESEGSYEEVNIIFNLVKFQYEAINAIELWLEDAVLEE